MNKKPGFTLVELFTAITIAAIIAAASAPGFSRMRREETFRSEVQGLFDALSQARTNAMSNKMCTKADNSKIPAVAWSVKIKQSPTNSHKLYCIWDETKFKALDINLDDDSYTEAKEETTFTNEFVKDFKFIYDTTTNPSPAKDPANDGTSVFIHFWTGSVQTTIIKEPYDDLKKTRMDEIRIVAESADEKERAICLDRVEGFPTFNKNGSTCLE